MKNSFSSSIKLLIPLMAVIMLTLYMIAMADVTDAIGVHVSDGSLSLWSEWEMVINYQAGWVRRALIGSIVHLGWDEASSINVYPAFGLLGMVLALITTVMALFIICKNVAITSIIFIASPFLAWYLVWDFEGFVFRKDYFIHSALVIHSLLVYRFAPSVARDSMVIVIVLLVTLIHEMAVFTLPAHWLIHHRGSFINAITLRKPEPIECGFFIIGLVGISSGLVKLNGADITAICHVLPEALRTACATSGPMLSIVKPSSYFFSEPTTSPFSSLGYWLFFAVLWLGNIALLYRLFTFFRTLSVPFWVATLFSILAFAPLLVLAIDWGRWFVLGFATFLAICLASIDQKGSINALNNDQRWVLLTRCGVLFICALFVRIPHCCTIQSETFFTPLVDKVPRLGSFNK